MESEEILSTEEESPIVEKSIDDTIRETYRALTEEAPEAPTEESAPVETKARDEKGRFSKEESVETVIPPELQKLGLKKEEAEAFTKADQLVRDALIRRSEDFNKGLEQYKTKAQIADEVSQAIEPFKQTLGNISPAAALKALLTSDHILRNGSPEQKQAMLTKLASDYGIPLNGEIPKLDPMLQSLSQRVQQLQGFIETKSREEQEREVATLNSEIAKFSSDPSNAHFESVKGEMAGLLQSGLATDLKDAYDKACWANPSIRTQILAKQQEEAEAKRKAEASQKAQEAKRAAAANVTRRGVVPPKKPTGTMEDTIRETYQRLMS